MSVIEEYHLFLNSSQRVSGTNSNCSFSLYQPIKLRNQSNNFFVRVGSCEIPFTFNPINSTNNTITFSYNRVGIITTFTGTITQGQYNPTTFLSVLQSIIQANTVFTSFSFVYSSTTGYLSLTCKGPDTSQTTLQITNCSEVVKGFLGINTLPSATFGFNVNYLYLNSVKNVLFNPINSVYVRSENIRQSQNYESLVVKKDISDILAKVQISVQPNSFIVWVNYTDLNVKVSNKYFDVINLYLTNNLDYNELNLNGLDFSIRLTIQEVGDINIPKTIEQIKEEADLQKTKEQNQTVGTLETQKKTLIDQLLKLKEELLGKNPKESESKPEAST